MFTSLTPPESLYVKKLLSMIEATQAGTWEWNVQTGECRFNKRWAEIIGYQLDELAPTIDSWLQHSHPEDLVLSNQRLQDHFAGRSPFYECEARMRHKDGHWVWVRDSGRCETWTDDGKPEWVIGSHIEITHLVELRHRFSTIASLIPGVVYEFQQFKDGRTRFPYASAGIKEIYGVEPEHVIEDASAVFETLHPDDMPHITETIAESRANMTDWICEYRVVVDGKERWVFGQARPVYKTNDSISWYGMIVDISERKMMELELERSRRNLKQAQALTKLGHWEANLKEKTIYWSDMIYTILGWREKPDSGDFHFFRDRTHPDDLDQIIKAERELKPGHTVDIQHRIQHTDGHYLWVRQIVEMEADGEMVLGTLRDITEEKELELKLKEQAERDPLTGAYNRRFFTEALETLVYRSERYEESLAIVTFDIDHFKRINDNFGHEAGDRVLIELVQTLGRLVRESDIFARTGGEEFSLLLPNQTLQQATHTAERFRAALEALVIRSEGNEIKITASFGVAIHRNGATHNEVLRHADKALYAAKSCGRNCVMS